MSPSPESKPQEGTSVEQEPAAVPTTLESDPAPPPPAPRSILAFLGGQPRSNPLALNPNAAKRRKKNDETPTTYTGQSQTQGRIVLKPANGASWAVETNAEEVKDDPELVSNGKAAKGKARGKRGGGEEDEMKEMGKRAKAAQKGRGGKRPSAGKRKAGDKQAGQLNLKASQDDDEEESDSVDDPLLLVDQLNNQSPKKKRGRPPKPKPASEAARSRKTTRSTSGNRASHSIPYVRSSSPNDVVVTGGSDNNIPRRCTKQPAFSRANTGSAADLRGQSQRDAIDVEQSLTLAKPGPKKLVFASDANKPAHSFFSRKADVLTSRAMTEEQEPVEQATNGTETQLLSKTADLIMNASKPVVPEQKVHNFFKPPRAELKSKIIKTGWGHGIKEGEEWLPLWPGRDWPSHHGIADSTVEAGPSCPRRPIPEVSPCVAETGFWSSHLSRAETSEAISNARERKRPGLAREVTSRDRETLCEQFRPRAATQVIGNVTEAMYLRDWLSALVVGTRDGNGPRVIRKVPKRKLGPDDWIVDDIGEFGDSQVEEEEEMPEPYEEPDLALGQRPTSYPPLSAWLTNTILLCGPNGSGKSAAVYAAANELGWEVFEVYPGIGKRTGGNLLSLVGDVGKNHMVGKARDAEAAKASPAGLKGFFDTADHAEPDDMPPLGSQGEPIEIDHDHLERTPTPPPRLRNQSLPSTPFHDDAKSRQSLILLEEVDILFDEEATFWPAVISLIAESKRPIIMTCNDPERLMLSALPLQAILQFHPPSRALAISHLSSLCDKLGLERDEAYLADLCDRNTVKCPRMLEMPGPPNGNEWLPTFDLRRAIMQLQLERGIPMVDKPATRPDPEDLGMAVKRAEVISYTDAFINQRSWATMELFEVDRYQATPDDQLGVKTLLKPTLPDHVPILPAYDRSTEISEFLLERSGGAFAEDDLYTDQVHYTRSLLPLLDPIIPLSSRLLPHPTLFTEYMPAIQNLVQIDDIRQAEWDASKAAGEDLRNIKTGRPVRLTAWLHEDYTRALPLEGEVLQIARREMRYE